jgi:bHLH factor
VGSSNGHQHDYHPSDSPQRPPVGSEEWHKQRRDNHKEVERRRRETINDGIAQLAQVVPNCEKNKGNILARAVQYIQQLKESESHNIEKWTLDKLLTDQAMAELQATNEKLKVELERAWREAEAWKKTAGGGGDSKRG